MSTPTVSLHVKITIAPENVDKFLGHFKSIYDIVSSEPECLFFEVYQNPDVPGEFKLVENWNATQEWVRDVRFNLSLSSSVFGGARRMECAFMLTGCAGPAEEGVL